MADTVSFSAAMKQAFVVPIRRTIDQPSMFSEDYGKTPDEIAWRDAVRWLEARKAAAEEWPWPQRSDA